jgi:crotonobetainyl-CoA:carnitine CoA-transferase CaiB-like acyl-CoA transferase
VEQLSPLAGVRVLDLSRIIAGPMAAQILADCGADVVKIEAEGIGDPSRTYVAEGDELGRSPIFGNLNRNKRSVVLDLKDPEGRAALLDMVRGCDVLVHNFRQGVMERLGLSYPELRELNPRLVYCSISGFGDRGPYRYRAANDVVAQAFGGVMSFTGEMGRQPVRSGASIADVTTALWATIGIMTALFERTRTGSGREVTTSLFEGQVYLAAPYLIEYVLTGVIAEPMGSGTKVGLPNGTFPTKDRPVLIAAVDERVWQRLCAAIGAPELAADPRFATLPDRRANRAALEDEIGGRTGRMTSEECLDLLQRAGVPSGPINSVADVVDDPQFKALDMFAGLTDDDGHPQPVVRLPFSLDGGRFVLRGSAPALGRDTKEALAAPADVWREPER